MLIAEELLLIALDDVSGRDATRWVGAEPGLAGALLLDLSLAGAIELRDGKVDATGDADDPLLAEALAAIREQDKPRDAKHWVQRLPRALKPLRDRVAERLVDHGVLRAEHRSILGIRTRTRYPEVDPGPERELRDRLEAVLVTGASPDPRTALLISLLVPLELVRVVVPKEHRREANRRAKEVADRGIVGTGLDQVVKEMQAAVMASVVAATVASSSASGSS